MPSFRTDPAPLRMVVGGNEYVRMDSALWLVTYKKAPWGTVVIRAAYPAAAHRLAVKLGQEYLGDDVGEVLVRMIPINGPEEAVVESWA